MVSKLQRVLSGLLCLLMLFALAPNAAAFEHLHLDSEHDAHGVHGEYDDHDGHNHGEYDDHDGHDHGENGGHKEDAGHASHDEHIDFLAVCEDVVEAVLYCVSVTAYAEYEDGVECDYCGAWRYDDWKCENGDHCGEGSGTSCYEEHHCGYCGACDDDHELCDDCGNCLEIGRAHV